MAIDYVIDHYCVPKQTLTTDGIIERLKGRDRAAQIIRLYRENDDPRPPSEMGFDFTRHTPDGDSETELIVVQDVLDYAADLDPLAEHCLHCPANRTGRPFGCTGFIQYPISVATESWLLNRLPNKHDALLWLLLRQGIDDFQYDGATIRALRQNSVYFDSPLAMQRRLSEFTITGDQVFEMLFSVGDINPNHAGLLLLFFHVIPRDLQADAIMNITPAGDNVASEHPFSLEMKPNDDPGIAAFKDFFYALYIAWALNVRLKVDA